MYSLVRIALSWIILVFTIIFAGCDEDTIPVSNSGPPVYSIQYTHPFVFMDADGIWHVPMYEPVVYEFHSRAGYPENPVTIWYWGIFMSPDTVEGLSTTFTATREYASQDFISRRHPFATLIDGTTGKVWGVTQLGRELYSKSYLFGVESDTLCVIAGEQVRLRNRATGLPGIPGRIAFWDFGDGSQPTVLTNRVFYSDTSHVYSTPGIYYATFSTYMNDTLLYRDTTTVAVKDFVFPSNAFQLEVTIDNVELEYREILSPTDIDSLDRVTSNGFDYMFYEWFLSSYSERPFPWNVECSFQVDYTGEPYHRYSAWATCTLSPDGNAVEKLKVYSYYVNQSKELTLTDIPLNKALGTSSTRCVYEYSGSSMSDHVNFGNMEIIERDGSGSLVKRKMLNNVRFNSGAKVTVEFRDGKY